MGRIIYRVARENCSGTGEKRMHQDCFGNPLTVGSADTVKGVDDFILGFLSYEEKALNILPAADADPDSAVANAYAAMLYMFMESVEGPPQARKYLERAQAASAKASDQECGVVAAAAAWVENDIPGAIRFSEEFVQKHPRELAVVKACQYHQFNLGDAPGMLRIAKKVADANEDLAYMHGMLAFAYEQCHLLAEAEVAAHQAIHLKRKEPWAQHALAHVMLTEGRIEEGMDFFDEVKDTWTELNSFMYTHNWWHFAVFHLARGNDRKALSIYDKHCWGILKDYSQDQIGAVSLLLRLELIGVDVGNRWSDVGEYLKARVDDHVQPFLTMHYVYGLARAELQEADALMASLRDHAASAPDFRRAAWTEVCLPACEGLLAHARGDYEQTVAGLSVASPRLAEIGGSHAQRDLFDMVLLDAMVRTNRLIAAQGRLEVRRQFDSYDVWTNANLATVYGGMGLKEEADRAYDRSKV